MLATIIIIGRALTWNIQEHCEQNEVVEIKRHVGRIWERVGPLLTSSDHRQGGKEEQHLTLNGN